MCYQRRVIYALCNHSASLVSAGACPDGKVCEDARVHPLKTVRIEQLCASCGEKKARADCNVALLREKVRSLRAELEKKGFGGGGTPGCVSGCATGAESKAGTADGAREEDHMQEKRAVRRSGNGQEKPGVEGGRHSGETSVVAGGAAESMTMSAATSATPGLLRRSDLFVGGVCLDFVSLTTISGKRLI